MHQFVFVLDFTYNSNKSFSIPTVTNQERPMYQAEQNNPYQLVSLKKGVNKKLFAKADTFVNKLLSLYCFVFKSFSQIRRLQNWMVWKLEFHYQTSLNIFFAKMQIHQRFTLLYLTLLAILQLWL